MYTSESHSSASPVVHIQYKLAKRDTFPTQQRERRLCHVADHVLHLNTKRHCSPVRSQRCLTIRTASLRERVTGTKTPAANRGVLTTVAPFIAYKAKHCSARVSSRHLSHRVVEVRLILAAAKCSHHLLLHRLHWRLTTSDPLSRM